MNKLVKSLLDDLHGRKPKRRFIVTASCTETNSSLQKMSNEDVAVDSSNVLLLWVRIGRVSRTINLEGYYSDDVQQLR